MVVLHVTCVLILGIRRLASGRCVIQLTLRQFAFIDVGLSYSTKVRKTIYPFLLVSNCLESTFPFHRVTRTTRNSLESVFCPFCVTFICIFAGSLQRPQQISLQNTAHLSHTPFCNPPGFRNRHKSVFFFPVSAVSINAIFGFEHDEGWIRLANRETSRVRSK